MNKIFKSSIFTFVLLFILTVSSISIFASQISELENEQESISEDIKKQQEMLEEANKQIQLTKDELVILDEKLEEAKNKLLLAEQDVENATEVLNETEMQLNEIQLEYEVQLENFKKRLRVMYQFGDVGYIEVLLGSESFADFFNRLEYINAIAEHDRQIVDDLYVLETTIQTKLDEIELQKIELEKLLFKQTTITDELRSSRENKSDLIQTLDSDAEKYQNSIDELEQSSKEIENTIKKIQQEQANQNNKVYYTGGIMEWPVPSNHSITSPFGNRIHPITGVKTFHKGIDIPANSGKDVVSAESGVVISATYINGYGNTVIVDHGDGISTLYAHNSSLTVSVGQEVARGDVVALIGSTGFSTGPHLHFEVRKDGVATNPMDYLGSN